MGTTINKGKILNFLLIITSLVGYLEWGRGHHTFLFQAEAEILSKAFTEPLSVFHPFTVIPLLGQIILLITLFQKHPGKWLTTIGIACIGLLLGLMFFIGCIGLNIKIMLSTLPFLIIAVVALMHHWKKGKGRKNEPQANI